MAESATKRELENHPSPGSMGPMSQPPAMAAPANDEAMGDESGVFVASQFPPPVTESRPPQPSLRPVHFRVVVACDLSEISEAVLDEAVLATRMHERPEFHVLTVLKGSAPYRIPGDSTGKRYTRDELTQRVVELVQRVMAKHHDPLDERFHTVSVHLGRGKPAEEILHLAEDVLADLIVLGSQERSSWYHFVHGSTTEQVLRAASASVLVARPSEFAHGHKVPTIAAPREDGDWGPHIGRRHTYHVPTRGSTRSNSSLHWEM